MTRNVLLPFKQKGFMNPLKAAQRAINVVVLAEICPELQAQLFLQQARPIAKRRRSYKPTPAERPKKIKQRRATCAPGNLSVVNNEQCSIRFNFILRNMYFISIKLTGQSTNITVAVDHSNTSGSVELDHRHEANEIEYGNFTNISTYQRMRMFEYCQISIGVQLNLTFTVIVAFGLFSVCFYRQFFFISIHFDRPIH